MPPSPATPASSAFEPLRHATFRLLWIATVIGNIGTWIRDVASGWAMTGLSTSPLLIALVQAMGSLPLFLIAVPAGALADLFDRRRLLLVTQLWLGGTSLLLAMLAATGSLGTHSLLALTFAGGVGAALMAPTWQAIVPELVPRSQLRAAVALNSLGVNISRAIGPALGGLVLAIWGLAPAYLLDVLTYVLTALALLWWRRAPAATATLPEHFGGAVRAGIRYAWHSPELQRILLRGAGFFLFASALWALLPVIARQLPRASAGHYGLMLGAVGVGAVAGALLLPRLRARTTADWLLRIATTLVALSLLLLAFVPQLWLALGTCLLAGMGWIIALTTLGASVQAVLPDWVRGRGLALYLTAFYGSMSLGSVLWGQLAATGSLPFSLCAAGAGAVIFVLASWRWRIPSGSSDLTPARSWPDPLFAQPVADDAGPVWVIIEYRVQEAQRQRFLAALRLLAAERQRHGATGWRVLTDVSQPEVVVELFLAASMSDHLRHHARVTVADADLQAEVWKYHVGPHPPQVRHLVPASQQV